MVYRPELRICGACEAGEMMPTIRMNSGHSFAQISGAFMDAWGDGPLLIRDGKRRWYFEFSEMFGPVWLTRKGRHFDVSDKQPVSESDPFWSPFSRWMSADRKCRPITTRRGRLIVYLCYVPPEGLP